MFIRPVSSSPPAVTLFTNMPNWVEVQLDVQLPGYSASSAAHMASLAEVPVLLTLSPSLGSAVRVGLLCVP